MIYAPIRAKPLTNEQMSAIVQASKANLEKSRDAKLQGPSQDGSQLPGTKTELSLWATELAPFLFLRACRETKSPDPSVLMVNESLVRAGCQG